jgi:hypothetical protein
MRSSPFNGLPTNRQSRRVEVENHAPDMVQQVRGANQPFRAAVDVDVLAQMATEAAVTVAASRRETLTRAHLSPELAEEEAVPDLGEAALVKVAMATSQGLQGSTVPSTLMRAWNQGT